MKTEKAFLKYLSKETDVTHDLKVMSPRQKVNCFDKPVNVVVCGINDSTLGMAIFTCGCMENGHECGKILGVEVLYHVPELRNDAEIVASKVISTFPDISYVTVRDRNDLQ